MGKRTFWTLACAVFWVSGTALAQPLPELCAEKDKAIAGEQAKVDAIDKEIAELTAKLDALKKQQDELTKSLAGKNGEKSKLQAKVKADTKKKDKTCAPLIKCAKYEKSLDDLKGKHGKLGTELAAIKKAAAEQKQKAQKLKQELDKIEKEYAKLGCDNLELEEGQQKTADTCNQLFADWTAKQAEIDKVKSAVGDLKKQHKKQRKGMKAAVKDYKSLQKKMKVCSFSKRLPEVDAAVTEQEGYDGLDKEIDEADKEANNARGVKIVKPKITIKKKPAKKAEPAKAEKKEPAGKKAEPAATKEKKKRGIKLKLDVKGDVDTEKGEAKGKVKGEAEVTDSKGKTKKSKINVGKKLKLR